MATFTQRRAREITRRSDAAFNRHILEIAPHLADADRILVTQYFLHDVPLADLATFRNVSPRQISRDIRRISHMIADSSFDLFLAHRGKLPTDERALATAHFLHGLSLRELARQRHWTLYRTHKTIQTIKTALLLCQASAKTKPPAPPLMPPEMDGEPEDPIDPFFRDDDND